MRNAALCLTMLVAGLSVGCAGPTPTPTPEPTATATPEPTATATPEGLTVGEYGKLVGDALDKQTKARTTIGLLIAAGAWMKDQEAWDNVIGQMKEVIQAVIDVKKLTPPAGMGVVHGRMVQCMTNYSNAMTPLADYMDMVKAGDLTGAPAKMAEATALINAGEATVKADTDAFIAAAKAAARP